MRPIDGQTLHQHRYRAGGGSPFRTPRVHPCEITCVSFHKKGEGESERERDCQQDADNGDDPILPPRQPRSREISLLPIQRIRALPTRVSRRVTTPFLRVPRKRGRETTKLPRVSLSLSLSLVSFRVEYHLSRFLAFHYHLFFFLAGVVENNDAIENRGGRGFFLSLSRPPRRKFRLKHATCAHSYAILGRRFVSIPLSSFLD